MKRKFTSIGIAMSMLIGLFVPFTAAGAAVLPGAYDSYEEVSELLTYAEGIAPANDTANNSRFNFGGNAFLNLDVKKDYRITFSFKSSAKSSKNYSQIFLLENQDNTDGSNRVLQTGNITNGGPDKVVISINNTDTTEPSVIKLSGEASDADNTTYTAENPSKTVSQICFRVNGAKGYLYYNPAFTVQEIFKVTGTVTDGVTSVSLQSGNDEPIDGVISGDTVTFTGVPNGEYTVLAEYEAGYNGTIDNETVTVSSGNVDNVFTVTAEPNVADKSIVTIQYRDEENNKIKADTVFSETYVEGGTYTVPDEMKKDFAIKTEEGYNFYHFNEGKSQLTVSFAKEMTITLVFNNTDQYAYYEDFENYTVDLNNWHKGAGDAPVILTDSSEYLSHSTGSSTTSGYMTFDEVDTTDKTVKITADVKIAKHTGTGESQFTIGNTSPSFDSNNINYGASSGANGHILHMAYAAKDGSFKVNGQSADAEFLGDWMHIEADIDFGSKAAVIKLTNDNGKSETIETKTFSSTFSSNLGSFYMRSGGTEGSVSLDNLIIKITGTATPAVPDIESPLNYKSVYAFGDSIVYGHNTPAKSFMRIIANEYAMDLNMLARNGATIMKSDNHILTQIKNAPVAAPDFVVFDGYTNDAYAETMDKLGKIQGSSATTFDNTTFCGAFEETLYTMKQKWPDSEIVFVTIHKSSGRDWDVQVKLRELSLEMCKAWDVSVADVFNDATLDTRDEEQLKKYIINGAGSHPNEAGCREFYIPVMVETLEGILDGGSENPNNHNPNAPTGLLTNELTKPLNIEKPTFGWLVNDADYDEIQTAYQIVVTDEITKTTVWDSDKVVSSEQSYVEYGGNALEDGHPYSWKVRTWDKDGAESPYSDSAYFATGIANNNWDASWISSGETGANHYWYARYEKSLDNTKTIARVMAYFAGVHDYELNVNGEYIGRGQSFDYASETRYQGWDITENVQGGSIAIGLLNRYYGGGQGRAASREALLGHINIYYTDGTKDTIVTNGDWKVSTSVPLGGSTKRNSEGDFVEEYNARNAQEEFSNAGFDASSWSAASVIGSHPTTDFINIIPEISNPTDYIVKPVSVTKLLNGITVADFGKVIPARPQITFKNGTAGRQLTIQTGYVINADGTVNSSSRVTQSTNMTYKYTQKSGEQVYNAWDHLAFRYIQIPDCGEDFTTETITARVVHTNVPDERDSTLETSNTMLNDVYELLKRSALYSIQNQFVDTPTREKGQFLQDSINISEASTATSYERAASKKAIEQFLASADRYWTGDEAGRYNSVYPNCDGKRDIPDFSLNVPYWVWNYYMTTGDKVTLEKAYPYIKATADYITKYINSETGLVTQLGGGDGSPNSYQYGIVDWPAVGRFGYDWSGTKTGARTTVNMLSKRAFDVVALAAQELGHTADAEDMQNRSDSIKTAINSKLINSDGIYCDGLNSNGNQVSHASQHATSYVLAFNVAPDDKISAMSDYVAAMGMKQGPMTADILVKSLFNTNENTAALKLFTEPNDNGWAKEVANDYTFTWEAWDANNSSNENSQSHGWGATAAADILENFAGVTNLEPGASKVQIAPVYTDLTSLDARVSTERGNVDVSYVRSENSYDIDITIPANMTADIVLPVIGDGKFTEKNGKANDGTINTETQTITVGSGQYSFSYDGSITILPEKVEYKEPLPEGISGEVDTENKTYTWSIGASDIASENGVTYSDKNDYADLTVSLAKGDYLSEGIVWNASSVRETNTNGQKNLGDTKRYLLVEPKYDGTFSMDIAFNEAAANKKNRVYCADLGENADIANLDLKVFEKGSYPSIGDDVTSTGVTTKTIDMTAGHAYIIYTYQYGSTISTMSYTYTGEAVITPPPTGELVTKITADYTKDGALREVYTELVDESEVEDTVNTPTHKVFYWDSLNGMKPLAKATIQ